MGKKVLTFNVFQFKRSPSKKTSVISFSLGVIVMVMYCVASMVVTQRKMTRISFDRFEVVNMESRSVTNKLRTKSEKNQYLIHSSPIPLHRSLKASIRNNTFNDLPKPQNSLYISDVRKPVIFRHMSHPLGAWMKDPASNSGKIYVMENFFSNNVIQQYQNETDPTVNREYKLPYNWGGTGHVVLDDCIYYSKYNSNILIKYEFKEERTIIQRELPDAGFGNQCPYKWGGSTDIDFAIDQTGLWVIYSTKANRWNIVISQMDSNTLEILKTWKTKIPKRSVGNAFIANAVLYAIQRHDSSTTRLHIAFDSATNKTFKPNLPFFLKYHYLTMLDYNHKERKFYAYDKGYLVTYDVTF
ncbi:unnamed protein product [Clavelina lepadiformis]|uniref:Olfactomedin-like domain-containing protein n=2 Tax=Clavelina lepadiformis TaxID=159417 RepID=A0ABP0F6K8_CLALP